MMQKDKPLDQKRQEEIERDRAAHPEQYAELDAYQGHRQRTEEELSPEEKRIREIERDRVAHPEQYAELDAYQGHVEKRVGGK